MVHNTQPSLIIFRAKLPNTADKFESNKENNDQFIPKFGHPKNNILIIELNL